MMWPMVCAVCGQTKWTRKEWFTPQWERWEPVIEDHHGCTYDRCQDCDYNKGKQAPACTGRRRDDRTATILAKELEHLRRPLATWEEFLDHWMNHPKLVKTFHPFGAVEVINETDPKQTQTRDGR